MIKNRLQSMFAMPLLGLAFCFCFSESKAQMESDSIIVPVEEIIDLSQEAAYVPMVSDELIADRLKSLQKDITLSYNKTIRSFIDYFTVRNRRYPLVMERRKNLYFSIFEETLKKHGMPDELKYLAIVESGLNPRAISRVGAAGLWQFMPVTGREYQLYQDEYIDERLDPYKSTDAACRYLKEAYRVLGDWHLAIASYNCGLGNVRRAIRKSGYRDSFWEVYKHLPQETRAYVPQFIALTYVMNHLTEHNIVADSLEYPMQYDTIMVNRQPMNLDVLCTQLNICPEEFMKLNPSIKKNIIPAKSSYVLRIPSDKSEAFASNRLAIMDSCSGLVALDTVNINESLNIALQALKLETSAPLTRTSKKQKVVYTVRRGDVLSKISGKYNVSIADIKKWNNFRANTVRAGQKLAIYKDQKSAKTAPRTKQVVVNNAKSKNVRKKSHYLVQPGDTLWTISQKNDGIPVERIKKLNKLKNNEIRPGQKLILG
jgi:membrane-bound lytic murein transglycosylase D